MGDSSAGVTSRRACYAACMDTGNPWPETSTDDGLTPGQRQELQELMVSRQTRQLFNDPLARARWAAEHDSDVAQIERAGDANTVYWIKPLWWTLGAGLTGCGLFIGQIWFGDLAKLLGLNLGAGLPWLRFLAMLVGGLLIVFAAPAPITRDRVPASADDPPLSDSHEPLKTKHFE